MYNTSPYAKSGNFNGGVNSGNANPFGGAQTTGQAPNNTPESPYKPNYASGGGLNQNPGGMQQQQPWTPSWFNSFTGQTGNGPNNQGQQTPLFNGQPSSFTLGPNGQMIPTNPVTGPGDPGWRGGGGNTQAPSGGWTTVAGDYPNGVPPGTPAGSRGAANPSVPSGPTMPQFNLDGRDDPRRFAARPQLSMQQMRQFRQPYRPANGYTPVDGNIEPIYPPPPQDM